MKGPENPEEAAKGCYEGGMSAPHYDIEMCHSPFIRTCRKGTDSVFSFIAAIIYLATFILSILYWSFDEIRQGRIPFSRRNSSNPLNRTAGGGTYGAVNK